MKILYATDGAPHSEVSAELLLDVADRGRNTVTVLSVFEAGTFLPIRGSESRALRAQAEQAVDQGMSFLRRGGFRVDGKVAAGLPGDQIVKIAQTDAFDLVVVGAGQRGSIVEALIGSVSMYVLHHSPASVLMVHQRPSTTDRPRALIGVDQTAGSQEAIDLAGAFLDPDRVDVRVLSVTDVSATLPVPPFMEQVYEMSSLSSWAEETALEEAASIAGDAAKELTSLGFRTTHSAVLGGARHALLKEGVDGGFDIIIVGTRHLGPLRGALVGSVSDWIAHRSPATLVAQRANHPAPT